jgi:molecular chaperone GrpE
MRNRMSDNEQGVTGATEEQVKEEPTLSSEPTAGQGDAPDQVPEETVIEQPGGEKEESPGAQPEVDEVEALRQELAETKAQEAEYLDGWQRARAELSNARKRFQRDRDQAYANAKGSVLAQVLPVVDDFERALETMPKNISDHSWTEGIVLIQRNLERLLAQSGVTAIEATGQEFDPFLHEALTHEPSETVPEGHVIAELQKGYQMGDRVLRPSVVRVSAGAPSEAEAETQPPEAS